MRGSAYGEAGMDEQALADFNKAIGLDPNYAQAYANRALIYRHLNKLDLALADYDKALRSTPPMRRPILVAAPFTGCRAMRSSRSPTSIR